MELAGALGIALIVQSIKLFGKALIDIAQKSVLEGTWFNIRVDYYESGKLSLNCCLHKCFFNGTHLSDLTEWNTTSSIAQAIQKFAASREMSFGAPVNLEDQINPLVRLVLT